jgi:hypothetical protein
MNDRARIQASLVGLVRREMKQTERQPPMMNIKKSILAAITVSVLTPGVASAAFCAFVSGGFSPSTSVSCGTTTGSVNGDGPSDKVKAIKTGGVAGKRVEVRGRDQFGNFLHAAPKCQAIDTTNNGLPPVENPSNQLCTDVPVPGGTTRFFNGVLGRAES